MFNRLGRVFGKIVDLMESQSGSVCSYESDESFNGFASFADEPKREETSIEWLIGSK